MTEARKKPHTDPVKASALEPQVPAQELQAETHQAEQHSAGMPQLNPASYPSQLFWLVVTFVMLYVVLSRFVLPKISTVLETRQSRVDTDLVQATALKEQAEAARDAYEKGMSDARQRSQNLLAETKQALDKTASTKQSDLDATLAGQLGAAEAKIREARAKALDSLTPVAADLAGTIVEKLSNTRPSDAELSQAVAQNERRGA